MQVITGMSSDSNTAPFYRMFILSMISLCVNVIPSISFEQFHNFANFHTIIDCLPLSCNPYFRHCDY